MGDEPQLTEICHFPEAVFPSAPPRCARAASLAEPVGRAAGGNVSQRLSEKRGKRGKHCALKGGRFVVLTSGGIRALIWLGETYRSWAATPDTLDRYSYKRGAQGSG